MTRLSNNDIYNIIQSEVGKLQTRGCNTRERESYKRGVETVKSILSTDFKKHGGTSDIEKLFRIFLHSLNDKINKAIFVSADSSYRTALNDGNKVILRIQSEYL